MSTPPLPAGSPPGVPRLASTLLAKLSAARIEPFGANAATASGSVCDVQPADSAIPISTSPSVSLIIDELNRCVGGCCERTRIVTPSCGGWNVAATTNSHRGCNA